MSGAFEALLKLSRTQTAQSELAVQSQIASHQVQLQKKRREQEARERKERELEIKLRAKRFEEERKEEERKLKRAEEKRARERELEKREEQMRDALKYGPRKAAARASSSRAIGGERAGDSDGGPGLTRAELREHRSSPDVLTREEKRQRKLAAELRRSANSGTSSSRRKSRGPTTVLPDGRTVRRLPGGAVDYTTVSRLVDPDAAPVLSASPDGKSARERLAAMPSTLTKLNTVKRDLRTINEFLVDRAKARDAKTLAGDAAKEYSDWFGKSKKKETQPQSQAKASTTSSRAVSTAPPSDSSSPTPPANPTASNPPAAKSKPKPSSSFLKPINPKPSAGIRSAPTIPSSASTSKKRPRSPSPSSSPQPPPKRRAGARDIGSEIWSLFGKDKRSYVARDVMSDDEDMEADAASVLKEEQRSARLAHKEDSIALAEERRHDDEKRRRKKERERRERERGA